MPRKPTFNQDTQIKQAISQGYSYRDAASMAGVSLSYVQKIVKENRNQIKGEVLAKQKEAELRGPLLYSELSTRAQKAYDDFGYFQEIYLGRIPQPWQVEAAEACLNLLGTDHEEYLLINAPPGSGKSILFVHDIPAWLTIRDRAIRGQIGSITQKNANKFLRRLRTTLERVQPVKADAKDLRRGWAKDAVGSIPMDFGRFRPIEKDYWTAEGFIVIQHGEVDTVQKEPTWSAYGIDSGFIGQRYDIVLWDDLVDPKKHRTMEARRQLEKDYDDLCETRLDPDGLLVLVGQRLYADDLYHYNMEKVAFEGVDENGEVFGRKPKYFHLKFPAHYADKCSPGSHGATAPSYPEGCLLSNTRLPFIKLESIRANPTESYEVVYQQEDTDPTHVLVPRNWVYGDASHVGCLDTQRRRLEVPGYGNMSGFISILSCDPSPTMYWAIEWWLYHPESEQYFLMDLVRRKMEAPDFLGYNIDEKQFYGVAYDMVEIAKELGVPITHLIVESNVAQRFLSQYDHFKTWIRLNHIVFIPHQTTRNKSDEEYGVETVAPYWEFGHIRLPMGDAYGRGMSLQLIEEVTKYTGQQSGVSTDCLMAEWFMHWQMPNIYFPEHEAHQMARPSWMRKTAGPTQAQRALYLGKNPLYPSSR